MKCSLRVQDCRKRERERERTIYVRSSTESARKINKAVNNHLRAINLLMRKFYNSRHFNVYDFTCVITRVRMRYAGDVAPQDAIATGPCLSRLT